MEIKFCGGVQETTGSQHLITVGKDRTSLLLECGLFQGHRAQTYERNLHFHFAPEQLGSVVLSHAHIDHSGNLPNLVKQGYRGNIYSTQATAELCNIMLRDSAHIQDKDIEYLNKKLRRKGLPEKEPLYRLPEVEDTIEQLADLRYHRWFSPVPGVQARFWDAGHILGAAIVELLLEENGRKKRVVFTGDLGRKNLPILRDPEIPEEGADILITESTYGNRKHGEIEEAPRRLLDILLPVLERKGKVIIPSFAVERTQELVFYLKQLWESGEIPNIPVFVDSPMAVNVTEIFRLHPECFDEETMEYVMDADDPFGFGRLRYIRNVEESKALNELQGPAVIISASGMCEAGRILHHLKNNITDPRNLVLIVSYQAENTLGRRIVERHPEVRIFGELYPLRAEVAVMDEFSAHADADELIAFARALNERRTLQRVFIIHGEPEQSQALAQQMKERLGVPTALPRLCESYEL